MAESKKAGWEYHVEAQNRILCSIKLLVELLNEAIASEDLNFMRAANETLKILNETATTIQNLKVSDRNLMLTG